MTRLQIAETNLDSTVIAHSSSLVAIRRSALEKVDPDSMAEDTEEFLRVRRAGLRTIVDPSVVSVERTPSAFFDRFQQKQRRAHGIIRALCQNADMLFNPRYGRYGMIVLPVNFFLLLISPSLLLVDLLGLIYLTFTIHLLVGLVGVVVLILISSCYLSRRPSWLVATVDLQLFALVGMLNLLLGKSNPTWKVYRDK
jgi:cellulose synthase/poly-beta-1,6-N-acetylglucosamine synthase-like glycosyltransferase